MKPRVLVTRRWPEAVEAELSARYAVTLNPDDAPLNAARLRQALGAFDAVLPTVTDRIDADILSTDPLRCRLLGNFGVGFNHIDLAAARARGIVVTNTPDVLTDCTADIALLLILAVARRGGEGERLVRSGQWSGWCPTQLLGARVSGKTLGLVGFGRIAQAVARRAHHGFGMQILFHSPRTPPPGAAEAVSAIRAPSLDALMAEADFISLHCPGSAENRHLIDARRLALMKPSAFLINTARGDVVDGPALVAALKSRTIRGAGLDVYEDEPRIDPALLELDNAVLLPHLGSASEETRTAMGMRVLDNLDAFFRGEAPRDRVA